MILSNSDATSRTNSDLTTNILVKFQDADKIDQHFHYFSVIGKLEYSEKSTRLDIAYTVHQYARFSEDTRKPHDEAFKSIGI